MKRLATLLLLLCSVARADLGDQGIRSWTLSNSTDSVGCAQQGSWTSTVSGAVTCSQGTPPWSVSQSGTWTTGRTWTLNSSTDSVTAQAVQSGSWTTGRTWTLNSSTDSVSSIQGTSPWIDNISQFGGTNVSTGTGASGSGIPRVTVSNDSQVKVWDGTNTSTVKAASTGPAFTDTATVVTQRPDTLGSVTQTSVSCAGTSTTLLAASTATMFIQVRNPTTATQTVWIQFNGSAATAAAPSVDLAPGSEADFFAYGPSYLPTSQFNCISGGSASTLTLVYK